MTKKIVVVKKLNWFVEEFPHLRLKKSPGREAVARFLNLAQLISVKKSIKKYYALSLTNYHKIFRLQLSGKVFEEVLEEILTYCEGITVLCGTNRSNTMGRDLNTTTYG